MKRARSAPSSAPHRVFRRAALALLLAAGAARADDLALEDRLVRVATTYQIPNPFMPWQSQPPNFRSGYGIFISPTEVLTTERLVRNQTFVELLRVRDGKRQPATVAIADKRLNLALLHLPSTFVANTNLAPLPVAGRLAWNAAVTIAQLDDESDLQLADAAVSQISVVGLPDTAYSLLGYDLLSRLNVNGEGAPAIVSNTLAGLTVNFQASSRIASIVGYPFIARFLDDARHPPYRGPASGGFTWKALNDPVKRQWLRLPDDADGVLIGSTVLGTDAAVTLRPLDVLLAWNGLPIDRMGYYDDPEFGRLEFSHLIKGQAAPGDRVPVTIWRDGARQNLTLGLGGDLDRVALVPENVTGERAPYLVSGGLVIRELDAFMLRIHGQDWRAKADTDLLHAYIDGKPDQQPGDRVVVLIAVLPDPINIGYQELRLHEITAVNGQPIRNLREVFALVDRDGAAYRFTVKGVGVDLVLDRDALPEADARLSRQYRIPKLEYRGSTAADTPATPAAARDAAATAVNAHMP